MFDPTAGHDLTVAQYPVFVFGILLAIFSAPILISTKIWGVLGLQSSAFTTFWIVLGGMTIAMFRAEKMPIGGMFVLALFFGLMIIGICIGLGMLIAYFFFLRKKGTTKIDLHDQQLPPSL
jgi:hypothetical protein